MPPSKSGIADYSEALIAELKNRVCLTVFDGSQPAGDLSGFDVVLYHIGNNPWHEFVYEAALRHPGVVVMHEANLHHLIADITIRRGDWDAYVAEAELSGGPSARDRALQARTLAVGPDYEGVAMTRRLLDQSRGLVVHSEFVAEQMRQQGFEGPIATVPHGAWIPQTNRFETRQGLGIDENTPLIGAFGHIKPYKRIAESLRALRRLVKVDPRVRMILVGEPHSDFPVDQLIRTLGLDQYVRVLGFTPIEKFVEYMGACDIILNLRYPTVGETSGSLQRALGLGKTVIVSDIGSFAELPDDICLKVPTGPDRSQQEEDFIFEYLNVLVSRPELARAMGERAREWVVRECNWGTVADLYVAFLEQFRNGASPGRAATTAPEPAGITTAPVEPQVIDEWIAPDAREYTEHHKSRFLQTLEMTPRGDASKTVLEMGAYMQITPALKFELCYGTVRGCYFGKVGHVDHKSVVSRTGQQFECDIDLFDAERDTFPYPDKSFDTVLCCELIEHLVADPMHMMSEINRILKPGGYLVLTTPNLSSLRAISAILQGYHPAFFPAFIRPRQEGEEVDSRHNREYVPMEIHHLLSAAGFEVVRLETGEFLDEPHPEYAWVNHLLERYRLHQILRGDGIYVLGRKAGPVRDRWPAWLYS